MAGLVAPVMGLFISLSENLNILEKPKFGQCSQTLKILILVTVVHKLNIFQILEQTKTKQQRKSKKKSTTYWLILNQFTIYYRSCSMNFIQEVYGHSYILFYNNRILLLLLLLLLTFYSSISKIWYSGQIMKFKVSKLPY